MTERNEGLLVNSKEIQQRNFSNPIRKRCVVKLKTLQDSLNHITCMFANEICQNILY